VAGASSRRRSWSWFWWDMVRGFAPAGLAASGLVSELCVTVASSLTAEWRCGADRPGVDGHAVARCQTPRGLTNHSVRGAVRLGHLSVRSDRPGYSGRTGDRRRGSGHNGDPGPDVVALWTTTHPRHGKGITT
jgi:hypothetical protein